MFNVDIGWPRGVRIALSILFLLALAACAPKPEPPVVVDRAPRQVPEGRLMRCLHPHIEYLNPRPYWYAGDRGREVCNWTREP